MLWKSLLLASFMVVNLAPASWSFVPQRPEIQLAQNPRPSGRNRPHQLRRKALPLIEQLETADSAEQYSEVERIARQLLQKDPQNQYVLEVLANALSQQKKFAPAEAIYRQQISRNPLKLEAYEGLGKILKEQGKWEEALAAYRQAFVAYPANSYIDLSGIRLAFLYTLIESKRTDEALAFARQRVAVSTNSQELRMIGAHIALMFHQQGKVDEAIAFLRMTLTNPANTDNYGYLGSLLASQGKDNEAIEVYQQEIAIGKPQMNGESAYLSLGALLEKQQRWPEALAIYRKLVAHYRQEVNLEDLGNQIVQELIRQEQESNSLAERDSNIVDNTPLLKAQTAINEVLYKQQGWVAVQKEMQPIIQTTPDLAAYVFLAFGQHRVTHKHYGDALLAYQQAQELNKQLLGVPAYRDLFLAWTFTNQPQLAQGAAQKALSLIPIAQRQDLIKTWALLLDKGDRWSEAIDLYRQFLKSPSPESLLISLQLAKALERSSQQAEAEAVYRQISTQLQKLQQAAPQDPQHYTMQGNFHSQRQEYGLAVNSYQKAIGLLEQAANPKDDQLLSFSRLKLAENLRLTGQQPTAIALSQKVVKGCDCQAIKAYQPSTLHAMAYHGMALSFFQQGQIPEATAAIQKALALDPDYREAIVTAKRLNP
jgi:tetratricopeptide (TPR) repeat protein